MSLYNHLFTNSPPSGPRASALIQRNPGICEREARVPDPLRLLILRYLHTLTQLASSSCDNEGNFQVMLLGYSISELRGVVPVVEGNLK